MNNVNPVTRDDDDPKRHPDPITHAPGFHPVGTGVGAAAGGTAAGLGAVAAGAAMGTVVGPVGTAVGAAIGAVVGGLIGKGVAEGINPSYQEQYWRETFATRPYAAPGANYDDFSAAYQFGWECRSRIVDKRFEDIEDDLRQHWENTKGNSGLDWSQARQATRDAWDRAGTQPGEKAR